MTSKHNTLQDNSSVIWRVLHASNCLAITFLCIYLSHPHKSFSFSPVDCSMAAPDGQVTTYAVTMCAAAGQQACAC